MASEAGPSGSRQPSRYVDYTDGRTIEYTAHARERMNERLMSEDEVWWVLAHHDHDVEGDRPWKRELTSTMGGRTITVIVVALSGVVRIITVIED
jgi:hypothetical protein